MKISIAFTVLVISLAVLGSPIEDTEVSLSTKTDFSENAQALLREASIRAVAYLCLGENVLPEIEETICAKALYTGMGTRTQPTVYASLDCIDCQVAEPVCWDACPVY
ncbi:uncharacterized protein LOC144743122 [Ciona intestinalis]